MKLKGTIRLQTMKGRTEHWVKMHVENDYFLSLEISEIDGTPITTNESAFEALFKRFPTLSIEGGHECLNHLFTKVSLPPNAADVLHLTLGNFADFRVDRDLAKEVDEEKVIKAEDIKGQELEFELSENSFSLVSTSQFSDKLSFGNAPVIKAPSVGFRRDTIINLEPSSAVQSEMQRIAAMVFGNDFKLWNAQKQPIPFHVTLAQTNALNQLLEAKFKVEKEDTRELTEAPGMSG